MPDEGMSSWNSFTEIYLRAADGVPIHESTTTTNEVSKKLMSLD